MPFIKSIGSRIFGLAVILVFLMMLLASFLLWQVTLLNGEIQRVATQYQPLSDKLSELNESGLRRRIAFERWYGAIAKQDAERQEAVKEASENYTKFTAKVGSEVAEIQVLLNNASVAGRGAMELSKVRTLLEQVASGFDLVTAKQRDILGFLEKGEPTRAVDVMSVLDGIQTILQKQRSEAADLMASLLASSTQECARLHQRIVWVTILATITSMLLGLLIAALITRRLVRPVLSLMTGIRTVETGDLTVEVPISSEDEIGRLTKAFNYFIRELRYKEQLQKTFGKYIDPRILERVMADPAASNAATNRQTMSISFGDLAGFTGLGEELTPAGVVNLLNHHFTFQSEAIQHYQGVVDKFIGDAVMAFWGAPFLNKGSEAEMACRAALEQVQSMSRLRQSLPEITGLRKNLPNLDLRIGISTGEVVVGNIGSEKTRSYTVIGDTVNLASRLEHANRFYGTRILICGATRTGAGDAVVAREVDRIVVKGKTEVTEVFELVGMAGAVGAEVMALCERSGEALAAYRSRDWDKAERLFRECLVLETKDSISNLFLNRIAVFRQTPPAPEWTGEWVFAEK